MIPINQFYLINEGDNFIPLNYPEIENELAMIIQDTSHLHSVVKGEIIVSFFKDHSLKREWIHDYPELTEMITSRHFKSTHLQSLFDSCRSNKAFLAGFEGHIQKNVSAANHDSWQGLETHTMSFNHGHSL
jgi:hypothetical protein